MLVAVAVAVVVLPVHAGAEAADDHGWWGVAQAGPGTAPTVPPPPAQTVPPEGLFVQLGPHNTPPDPTQVPQPLEPTAIAAIRFIGVPEGADALLTLRAAPNYKTERPAPQPADALAVESLPIAACARDPRLPQWDGEQFGRWEARPAWDCDSLATDGVADEGGDVMTWTLGPQFQEAGVIDVILVPQGDKPFSIAFEKPDEFALTFPNGLPDTGEGFGGFDPAATEAFDGDFGATTEFDASTGDGFALGDLGGGGTGEVDAAEGQVEAFAGGGAPGGGGRQVTRPVSALPVPDSRAERMMAVGVLLGMAGALWWLGGVPARPPRLLGSLGGASHLPVNAAAPVAGGVARRMGGLGRFARPRSVEPTRL